jgi:carbonic anhydrase/acetyltransferase-like protein (isoleucine patch superfamily)
VSIHPSSFIHETAVVIGQVTLGPNVSIWPTAVIRADTEYIEIGEGTNIQDGAIIHCDEGIPCSIGKRVTVGHRAVVHVATDSPKTIVTTNAGASPRLTIVATSAKPDA